MSASTDTVLLGRTGVRLPRLAIGTATFGLQTDEGAARQILDFALDRGLGWLDTSTSYPLGSGADTVGVTESLIGRWMVGRRERIFLATKVYNRTGPNPWEIGLSRKHVLSAVEGSLERLGTDHIDLLQLHRFDTSTPLDETLAAIDTLIQQGKVRYIGCCNFMAHQIAQTLGCSDADRLPRVQTAQVRYNALMRGAEMETLPLCAQQGVSVLAFNLLAGGVLTGKYKRDQTPDAGRFDDSAAGQRYKQRYWSDSNFDTVDQLQAIADRAGTSLGALASAWAMRQPGVTAPIVGVSRLDQFTLVTDSLDLELPDEVWREVDEATLKHRHFTPDLEFESS
ncbi:aldo/keto reductase [Glaciibacter superstes]|uniref:aldo/keto reductase n=1 Tax=Glaciibacter superstes TaxID=501023 RepID=UPI0003B709C3|nr:aldo/keto reductase [Glaciibacter superstes]